MIQSYKHYYKFCMKKKLTVFMSTTMKYSHLFIYALLFLCTLQCVAADNRTIEIPSNRTTPWSLPKDGICSSRDVRNGPSSFVQLNGCRVIEGSLTISLMDKYDDWDFDNYTFPLLTEITDYFVMFRVNGIKTLSKLFPNLTVIRGNTLFQDYGLVIFELAGLQDIGLKSLTKIIRGNIRIEKNHMLCFVDTIDWDYVVNYDKNDNVIRGNKPANECPLCPVHEKSNNNTNVCPPSPLDSTKVLCWNLQDCQKICPTICGNNSCNDKKECCDASCVGGCTQPSNCTVCRGTSLRSGYNKQCIDKCPPTLYNYANSRCLTERECRLIKKSSRLEGILETFEHPFVPSHGVCGLECPVSYYATGASGERHCIKCDGICQKDCAPASITSIAAIQSMQGCTRITGSLFIQIRSQGLFNVVNELENALQHLEEIEGSLKIIRSFPIVSLSFFKSLRIIRGRLLETDRYALYIMDNQNLQTLFPQNVTIERGKIFFHFNPKLCYNYIENLKPFITELKDKRIAIEDVAINSNGDKISCNVTELKVRVKFVVDTAAVLAVTQMDYEDERSLLGYTVHFIMAPYRNVSMFDGRDACGGDGWRVEDTLSNPLDRSQTVDVFLTYLTPFTQYAYYAKTYTIASEPYGGQSQIQYFTTHAAQPSHVTLATIASIKSNEMVIKWGPPKQPNGNLTIYIITAVYSAEDVSLLDNRDYCKDTIKLDTILPEPKINEAKPSHTETPDDLTCNCDESDTMADEEGVETAIAFENVLHNIIFVKRTDLPGPSPERRRKRDIYTPEANGVITTSKPIVNSIDNDDDISIKDNSLNTNYNTISNPQVFPEDKNKSFENATAHTVRTEPEFDKDGKYTYIYETVNASTTSITLKNLKHYSRYKFSLRACHSESTSQTTNCSNEIHLYDRTGKNDDADDIKWVGITNTSSSNYTGGGGGVTLRWKIPENPNGVIVSFYITYKRIDIENDDGGGPICVKRKKFDDTYQEHNIRRLVNGNYSFQVKAVSLAGEGKPSATIYYVIDDSQANTQIYVVVGVLVCVLTLIIGLVYWYFQRKYLQPVSDLKLIASVNPEYISMQYQADEWEVPREKIIQLRELGQGSFGMVYEGIAKNLKNDNEEIRCAIKTANESATDRERANFLKEASVMKGFNTHHVVRLLGVVSRGQPTLVVMELMVHGDLKGYLRAHRPEIENPDEEPRFQPPTLKRILLMASEIADGMAYLSAKKFVHRDLAARNCMVSEDLTVKIGDFGMTRDIYETDYYRKGTKGLLPVRWMSPESLKDGVFSSSSDVFSYGVVLWEMATLASQPYQGLSNDQVLRYVIDGGVMERPENCPDKLYKMMIRTWQHRPSSRPTFLDIVGMLLEDVSPTFRQVSFYFSHAGQSLLEQQKNKLIHIDAKTPLVAEEDDFDSDADQGHLSVQHNSNSAEGDDKPSHSPLSSSIGLKLNSIQTDFALGKSKTNSPKNSLHKQPHPQQQHQQQQPQSITVHGRNGSTFNRGIEIIRHAFFGYGGSNNIGGESKEYRKMNNSSIEYQQHQPKQQQQQQQQKQQQQQEQNNIFIDEKNKTTKYMPIGNGFVVGLQNAQQREPPNSIYSNINRRATNKEFK